MSTPNGSLSLYAGVNAAAHTGDIYFRDAVRLIRTDSALEAFTTRARAILETHGKGDEYDAHKRGARAITWGGRFTHRATANLQAASGAVFIDIDGLANIQAAAAERARASLYPFTAIAYISLSGKGVHIVVRVNPKPTDAAEYAIAWAAAMTALGYDPAGQSAADPRVSDISRLAFLARDRDAQVNLKAVGLRWYKPPEPAAPPATPRMRAYAGAGGELLTLEEAVAAAGAHRVGAGYRARCLAHGGDNPEALSISMDGGELLVHCFTRGCEPTDIIAALRKAAGKRSAAEGLLYCAACNRDAVRKPEYPTCYECRPAAPRRQAASPPVSPLRRCSDCGRHLYADGGHQFDACGASEEVSEYQRRLNERRAKRASSAEPPPVSTPDADTPTQASIRFEAMEPLAVAADIRPPAYRDEDDFARWDAELAALDAEYPPAALGDNEYDEVSRDADD